MERKDASRRVRERLELALPVRVQCRESPDYQWEEESRILDVTPFGARFTVGRPTEPGRLLHLTLPMPRHLRCFDHDQEQYQVWGLVRHINTLPSTDDNRWPQFEIGVAFVGRRPPASFETDPAARYDVAGSSPGGNDSWNLRGRLDPDDGNTLHNDRRAEARHNIAVGVIVELYDAKGQVFTSEEARTENISRRGMAVITKLNVVRGRYVRLRSPHYKIAVIAAVRRLRRDSDGAKRLHLEFVDQEWPPLDEIEAE